VLPGRGLNSLCFRDVWEVERSWLLDKNIPMGELRGVSTDEERFFRHQKVTSGWVKREQGRCRRGQKSSGAR